MTNLDELERLAKAATPGPWCDRGFGSIQPESGGSLVAVTVTKGGCLPDYVENSAFIAAANPAAILALIAEVRALREDAERWQTHVRLIRNRHAADVANELVRAVDNARAWRKA
jgi:hypothetical protein